MATQGTDQLNFDLYDDSKRYRSSQSWGTFFAAMVLYVVLVLVGTDDSPGARYLFLNLILLVVSLVTGAILVHEGGHFLVARVLGIRALGFYFGHGPSLRRFVAFGLPIEIRRFAGGGALLYAIGDLRTAGRFALLYIGGDCANLLVGGLLLWWLGASSLDTDVWASAVHPLGAFAVANLLQYVTNVCHWKPGANHFNGSDLQNLSKLITQRRTLKLALRVIAHIEAARDAWKRDDRQAAEREIRAAYALDPSLSLWPCSLHSTALPGSVQLALIITILQCDFAFARELLEQAHGRWPTKSLWTKGTIDSLLANTVQQLGGPLLQGGDLARAVAYFAAASSYLGDHVATRVNYANALVSSGQTEQGLSILDSAMSSGEQTEQIQRIAQQIRQNGESMLELRRALALVQQEQYEEALALYESMAGTSSPTVVKSAQIIANNRAICLLNLGRPDEARALLWPERRNADCSSALQGRLKNNLAFANLLLESAELLPEAREMASEALQLLPEEPAVWMTYGGALIHSGEYELGTEYVRRALPLVTTPGARANALSWVALALAAGGDEEGARAMLESARQESDSAPVYRLVVARLDGKPGALCPTTDEERF